MSQQFWESWSRDYLKALQERNKWLKPSRSITPGDVVLLLDELQSPARWPLALASTRVHPGQDGLVRAVEVKAEKSTYTRPIMKLVLLLTAHQQEAL